MKKRLVALLLILVLVVPAAVAAAVTYYRVNTSALKLRVLPQEKAQVLDSFRQDFALTVQRKVGDWSYVTFSNGSEGYVFNSYIAKSKSYKAYVTGDNTHLRSGPNYTFSDVGTLARGAKVTVLSHGQKYDYVRTAVGTGYVVNSRLSKKYVKPSGKQSVPASSVVNYTAWLMNNGLSVKLRVGPSDSANVIDSYPSGTVVTVLEHNPVWDYVLIGSVYGYVKNKFLSKDEPAPTPTVAPAPAPFQSYTAYITSTNKKSVNMRKKAGKGYATVLAVPYGAQVTVLGEGSWYKIRYNNRTGYVEKQYIQLTAPDPVPVPDPTPTPEPAVTPAPFSPYTAVVTCAEGEKVNVRSGEGKGYTHLARLEPGTTVEVIALGTKYPASWAKVRVDGIEGYVMLKYLKKQK